MAFDLYFASVGNINADKLFNELGSCRLFAWMEKSSLKRWVGLSDNPKSKLLVDSGAYSAHSKGITINIDEYIDFLNFNSNNFTIFAQLDKIPGELNKPKTALQLKEAPKQSWLNYLYMRDRIIEKDKLLPVFHQGEDYKWLENMLNYEDDYGNIKYIGISPANDVQVGAKIEFIDKCFDIIKNSKNPCIKTHGFGMTSLNVLERYPFTSADSTRWKLNAAFGSIFTEYGPVLVSSEQKNNPKHISHLSKVCQDKIKTRVSAYGLDFNAVCAEFNSRALYNINFLQEWANNYEYKPITIHKKTLF